MDLRSRSRQVFTYVNLRQFFFCSLHFVFDVRRAPVGKSETIKNVKGNLCRFTAGAVQK